MKVEHRDKGRCPLKGHIAAEAAMNDIVRNYHCAPKIWISGRLISRSDLRKCLVQCGVGGIVGHLGRVAHWPQRVWTLWSSNPRPEAKLWNVIVLQQQKIIPISQSCLPRPIIVLPSVTDSLIVSRLDWRVPVKWGCQLCVQARFVVDVDVYVYAKAWSSSLKLKCSQDKKRYFWSKFWS